MELASTKMIDVETLEKLQRATISDRITIIEILVASLKNDLPPSESEAYHQRPPFGFMKDTGEILGEVVSPALPV